jgi:excisionase family DNA binding protein
MRRPKPASPVVLPSELRCSPDQVAATLGCTTRHVYWLIKKKRLPAVRLPQSHRWRVLIGDVEKLNRGESIR